MDGKTLRKQAAAGNTGDRGTWSEKYGAKHRFVRVTDFPPGVEAPQRVRIYRRHTYHLLQWWDPKAKRNLSERVDDDLVAAIVRARQIEERLEHFRSSGKDRRKILHRELVHHYVADLDRRADAGEIDPRTVERYQTALGHYVNFAEQPHVAKDYPSATQVDRNFALAFAAYLKDLRVSPNGHTNAAKRRLTGTGYVQDVVRSLFRWAADPQRGDLMPDGFRNPFGGRRKSTAAAPDLFGEPDITTEMAAEFLAECDAFQLPLFALIAFYGLRPSEPCYLFREQLADGWLHAGCDVGLDYFTKGRRGKRLPLVAGLEKLFPPEPSGSLQGLLFVRRAVAEGRETPALLGASLAELRDTYDERCERQRTGSARERRAVRDQVLREAGALDYDRIEHEFRKLAVRLNWPRAATLKDFRHQFSTAMQNAGMPEYYRKYLMGHAVPRASITTYTHLNELRDRYEEAVDRTLQPLLRVLAQRSQELEFDRIPSHERSEPR